MAIRHFASTETVELGFRPPKGAPNWGCFTKELMAQLAIGLVVRCRLGQVLMLEINPTFLSQASWKHGDAVGTFALTVFTLRQALAS